MTQSPNTVSAAVWPALHVEFSVISTLAPGGFFFPYLAPTKSSVTGTEESSVSFCCGELTDKQLPAEEGGFATLTSRQGVAEPCPMATQSRAWPKLRARFPQCCRADQSG